jgi:hypothetical protein
MRASSSVAGARQRAMELARPFVIGTTCVLSDLEAAGGSTRWIYSTPVDPTLFINLRFSL